MRGCLCCPVVFRHILSHFCFSPVGRPKTVFVSVFYTLAAKCVFNRSLIGARHKSPAVEWALYTKGGSKPLTNSSRSEFTTLSLISSNKVCGEHKIAPRLIQDLLENFSSRCWPRSPREIVFSRNFGKLEKKILPNWVHRPPFRQSLAGIFGNFKLLVFHCHRSFTVENELLRLSSFGLTLSTGSASRKSG